MQGKSIAGSSFTETVDLNQGCVSNDSGLNQSMDWDSMLNPVDSRLLNYMLSSAEGNFARPNAVSVRSFGLWDLGESSSSANVQSQGMGDGLKIDSGRSSLFGACPGSEPGVEEREFGPSNILLTENLTSGIDGNQRTIRPSIMQSSSSTLIPLNINLNAGHVGGSADCGKGLGQDSCYSVYKLSGPEAEHIITANDSSDNVETSSGGNSGYLMYNDGGSASSLANWGSSCKRKAREGTPGQTYPSGSSNLFQQPESFLRRVVPGHYNASSNLSISSPPVNSPSGTPSEQINTRIGIGMRNVASDVFLPSSISGIAESSLSNYGVRVNPGNHEFGLINFPSTGDGIRHSDACPTHQSSRLLSFTDSLDLRPSTSTPVAPTLNNPRNHSHLTRIPDWSRGMPPFPWNGTLLRAGGSSSSPMLWGDRSASVQNDANFGSTQRNYMEHPMFVSATDMTTLSQDSNNWNLCNGNASTFPSVPASSRFGGPRLLHTAWIPHHNPTAQNQQRVSEFAPWTLFPSVDYEAGGQRTHFPPLRSVASSEETMMSTGANNQGHQPPYPRSGLLEVPGDDVNGWHALATDIEGRQAAFCIRSVPCHNYCSLTPTSIRQVLNAMRRGENFRSQDYMLVDPFINGVAELHDMHRDTRLDVDNMSYEELLALEECIGDVNTGLTEETIMDSMQQSKYLSIMEGSPSNLEPCCICREEYVTCDDIGALDCGHDFHTNCIKQWLKQKNICPICKMTALGT